MILLSAQIGLTEMRMLYCAGCSNRKSFEFWDMDNWFLVICVSVQVHCCGWTNGAELRQSRKSGEEICVLSREACLPNCRRLRSRPGLITDEPKFFLKGHTFVMGDDLL
jgi:hypothetical protein